MKGSRPMLYARCIGCGQRILWGDLWCGQCPLITLAQTKSRVTSLFGNEK